MPVKNRFAELLPEITAWRRDLHAHPEILFETHRTAAFVAQTLQDIGCDEIVTGLGRTGVVGVIKGISDTSGKVIGLRADMDALPILEATGLDYASKTDGAMHACGHDGHTAMLLGADGPLWHSGGLRNAQLAGDASGRFCDPHRRVFCRDRPVRDHRCG